MKEEKIDRLIRRIYNDKFVEEPSPEFSDKVLEQLGVKKKESIVVTKPMKPRKGLLLMAVLYLLILALVFIIPGSIDKVTTYEIPKFTIPSLSQYLNLGSGISKLLIVLIAGGWALIFFDNYIKKLLAR